VNPPLSGATRRRALALAGAVALVAGVVALAKTREGPPARCAPGMIALGPRCCGEGQSLDGDRCFGVPTACAPGMRVTSAGCARSPAIVAIAGGVLHEGPGDWEAEGVVAPREAHVGAFRLDALEVTEDRYAECVARGACAKVPLSGEPGRPVVGVTFAEAAAFCAWAKGALPTGDQLAFATAGPAGRRYPWGDTGAVCRRAAFGLARGPCAHDARGPDLAGAHPDGQSPEGVFDLAGNVAEWAEPVGRADATLAEARGGSWADGEAAALRAWHRRELPRSTRSPEVGFRCAYAPVEPIGSDGPGH
jgi:formylglycine-generating enzyme required for sulfatase activity